MQELIISKEVLTDIEKNDVHFGEALKKVFQPNEALRPLRGTVSGLVGCELRHQMLFSFLLKNIEGLEEDENRLVRLALANDYYLHRLDNEAVKTFVKEAIGEKYAAIEPLFGKAALEEGVYPPEMGKQSDEYLSLRYNTPKWVLKMWQGFGYGPAYSLLRHFAKPNCSYLRVKTDRISIDEVLAYDGFKKTNVENVLSYNGKLPLRKVKAYAEGKMFLVNSEIKCIIDENKVSEPAEILCYSPSKDETIERELVETYGERLGMNMAVKSMDDKFSLTKYIKSLRYSNINYYEGKDPMNMLAYISSPVDLAFVYPESSNFNAINESPDFFLHFKKETLDSLIDGQRKALEGCAKYVTEFGTLIYMVSTANKKEGRGVVVSFLQSHPEWSLVKSIQHFPHRDGGEVLYEAILRKEPHVVKATEPLTDIPHIETQNNCALAAGK